MKKSGGVYVKLNGNQAVQRVPSTKGVGTSKSKKQEGAQITPGSKGAGSTKSPKAKVSPGSKKK